MSFRSEKEQYNAHVGRVARGAGISFLGQGVWRASNYATLVALAWMYGPAQLGFYVLGITLIEMSNVLSQLGMDNGVVRYVAHYQAQGDISRVRGTILLALWGTLALSVVLMCLLFFSAGFLADKVFGEPSLETVFKVFSASLPVLTLMNMALFATQGFQTVKQTTYVREILQPLMNFVLIIVFYLLGAQILGAAVAYVVSMLVGSLLALYYLKQVFPRLVDWENPAKFEARALFNASWPLTIFSFTQRINSWTSVLVLGIFTTASVVGIYNAAARLAELSVLMLFAFNGIFSPMVAALYGRGQMDDLGRLYQDVSKWVFTGALAVSLVTVVLVEDILAILGPEFVAGWVVLVVIAGAQLFNSSVGPTQRVLAMTHHQKVLMLATAGSALVGVALNFALIPIFGILGAAMATAAAIVLANVVTLLYVRRLLRVWPYSRRYAKPVVAGILAAIGVYLGKLAFPLLPAIPTVLIFAPVFLIGFVVLLLALGLSPSDRQLFRALWPKVGHISGRRVD